MKTCTEMWVKSEINKMDIDDFFTESINCHNGHLVDESEVKIPELTGFSPENKLLK
ncbi:hypothetical protein [Chryseobacterium sp.]|uniref:hypothetical protein n=1 Tax=Chryseobacterium sp. TaxID=1871047 RepID=UPI00334061C9